MTSSSSLYLSLRYNLTLENYSLLLMFSSIPVLLCYLKKQTILGLILSIISIITIYFTKEIIPYITIIKYFLYFIIYIILYKKPSFNYLFLRLIAVIQGFLISFEYLGNVKDFTLLIELLILAMIIYIITFISIYLFKLADDISNMHGMINTAKRDIEIKNSLFKLTHEVKNPIAVCKGYLDMLDIHDEDKIIRYTNIIKGEINRSLNIMNDFMECSKLKIEKEEFDMNLLLESIYDSFKILSNNKNIKLKYENNYEEIYFNGDYHRLEQVFVNILKNSIESITDNGIINLSVNLNSKKLEIKVSDNGCGMTPEELSNVTEMFYTTKKNGTGLGVALSKEIVTAHNGTIKYTSTKNEGTLCTLTFPI